VNFLAQNPKIPLSFHFEIPPVVLSLKLNFFIFFSISKTPSQVARSDLHTPRRLQSRQQLSAPHRSASPSSSHRSWEIVLMSPSASHRNTPSPIPKHNHHTLQSTHTSTPRTHTRSSTLRISSPNHTRDSSHHAHTQKTIIL